VRLSVAERFFERGEGAWLWDVDGNDYVDFVLGQGPLILGHAPARVARAVETASKNGMVFGAQHRLEIDAAEAMKEALGWPDLVRFGSSGTEIVQIAFRLARAVTDRDRIVQFEGHYHGWLDNVFVSLSGDRIVPGSDGQLSNALSETLVLPWNDSQALAEAADRYSGEIAAVVMEPVMFNAGAIPPRVGYLEEVREICTAHGILLIFDEVVTGFRLGLGGAAAYFGVTPDLATYGKAMAAGWPIAALAGPGHIMERLGSTVTHAGTFNGNVMATAATLETLNALADGQAYDRIETAGRALMTGLAAFQTQGLPSLHVRGFPCGFHVSFTERDEVWEFRDLRFNDEDRSKHFTSELAESGVWVTSRGVWYVSASHGELEVATTLERVASVLKLD
jgi:glutamate-1-semialdehyde 2,1-aminomutase